MDLSLVIPVKDEAENLPLLMEEIIDAIAPTGRTFEVIVIDDGSRDGTWDVLKDLAQKHSFLRLFRFQFNCGKADALSLGFSKAHGDYVATLDGDLQDDPHEIPKMMDVLAQGYDLVSGWKLHRHDPWHKTWPSKLFNLTVSCVCGQRLHDFNCGIKLYRSSVVRRARVHGVSKYGVSRLVSGFLDLLTLLFMRSFGAKPLHFFGLIGLVCVLFGGGVFSYFGYEWIRTGALHVRPLLVVGGFSLVMGVQFFSLGLLGEIINGNKKRNYPIAESVPADSPDHK